MLHDRSQYPIVNSRIGQREIINSVVLDSVGKNAYRACLCEPNSRIGRARIGDFVELKTR